MKCRSFKKIEVAKDSEAIFQYVEEDSTESSRTVKYAK